MSTATGARHDGSFVDAHVHFWDPERFDYLWLLGVPDLNRPFLPADLLRGNGSGGSGALDQPIGVVVVEADRLAEQARAEAEWVVGLSSPGLHIVGVVAHAAAEHGAACAAGLDELTAVRGVVGVRRLLQDQRPGFCTEPGFLAGVALVGDRGLPFDLCVRSHQLPEVTELIRRLPEVSFVLDHLGKPRIAPAAFGEWAADLARVAAMPNVRCKLSGLATEADPDRRTAADLIPFLRHAIDVFGPSRVMFGSDWPVVTTAMSYAGWLDVVREAIDDLGPVDRGLVMQGTAQATYGTAERTVTTD